MKLIIVESPPKAKTIQKYLGGDWIVASSVGHIRDLPKEELSVRLDTYQPTYRVIDGKQHVIDDLIRLVRRVGAENVFIASDDDREGEAIAAHLETVLGLRDPKRVVFHEINKKTILAALEVPGRINRNLVSAQEARRVLDRIEGYGASNALASKTGMRLTAGRTQTPGLRLVVEREEAIAAFTSRDHCTVHLTFDASGKPWTADWYFKLKPFVAEKETLFTDVAFAARVAALRDVKVIKRADKETTQAPPPAFMTQTLLQAGSARYHFNPTKTMDLAQKLHEKGYITYHATDIPNVSPDAAESIRAYATRNGFAVPDSVRKATVSDSAQGAHEAIRPSNVEVRDDRSGPEPLTADEQKLYELIWTRAVASQLAPAIYDQRALTLQAREKLDGNAIIFTAIGTTLKFAGYRQLGGEDVTKDDTDDVEIRNPVPPLEEGSLLRADSGEVQKKKTKPPSRFTQATLLKELERRKIGRPRTFAPIVNIILKRGYVEERKEGRTLKLFPTADGITNMTLIRGRFAIAEIEYTGHLEEQFDAIAAGTATYYAVVHSAHQRLLVDSAAFAKLDISGIPGIVLKAPRVEAGTCPQCSAAPLVSHEGKDGHRWWGCKSYPTCKATCRDLNGAPDLASVRTVAASKVTPKSSKATSARSTSKRPSRTVRNKRT